MNFTYVQIRTMFGKRFGAYILTFQTPIHSMNNTSDPEIVYEIYDGNISLYVDVLRKYIIDMIKHLNITRHLVVVVAFFSPNPRRSFSGLFPRMYELFSY